MSYACTYQTENGARCRNNAVPGGEWGCPQHNTMVAEGKPVKKVGLKRKVHFKFNVNPNWVARLIAEGVEERDQDFDAKEAAHIAQAESIGRDAFRYRKDISDSGVPIFGFEEGLVNVSVYEAFKDLLAAYSIVDVYIIPMRPGKNERMRKLVVYFANGDARGKNVTAIESILEFLSSSCWGHVHVWANPERSADTVNVSHREPDKTPAWTLRLAGGQWASFLHAAPVVVDVAQ